MDRPIQFATASFAQRRARAQYLFALAMQRGDLIRPDACERCGGTERKIHGHHDDYEIPLAVRWLCSLCHVTHHCLIRDAATDAHVGIGDLSCAPTVVVDEWAERVLNASRRRAARIRRREERPGFAAEHAAFRALLAARSLSYATERCARREVAA